LGTSGRDPKYGYGRVDAARAVSSAVGSTVAPADTQAPSVAIVSPGAGSTVGGLVVVDVSASDNVGVTKVELRVNGATAATDTGSPFAFSWDSRQVANGTVNFAAVAYDAAGNAMSSPSVAVNVYNAPPVADTTPPSIQIGNPTSGANVTGTVDVKVTASDNSGSAGVTQWLYIDGKMVKSATGGSLTYKWNTRKAAAGAHNISVTAQDAAGNNSSVGVAVYK
jgi:hypothetical protein